MGNEMKALLTITRHRETVASQLERMADELRQRARDHDRSKLQLDEFEGYERINAAARKYAYGSPEMKDAISAENCVALHYARNSHHPEHHAVTEEMSFMDMIEMVIDWYSASVTYGKTPLSESLPSLRDRYDFSLDQWWLVDQVVQWISGSPTVPAAEREKRMAEVAEVPNMNNEDEDPTLAALKSLKDQVNSLADLHSQSVENDRTYAAGVSDAAGQRGGTAQSVGATAAEAVQWQGHAGAMDGLLRRPGHEDQMEAADDRCHCCVGDPPLQQECD